MAIVSCKKPYGQDPIVTEVFPDSLQYPEITEIADNDDPFQFYRLARIKYNQGKIGEAIDYVSQAIELDDENPLYYYLLAQLYSANGNANLALENALKSYSLGYINPDLQVMIAKQYYAAGESNKGRQYLDIALRKNPDDPEMVYLKAITYLKDNDTIQGLQWLVQASSLDSSYRPALEKRIEVYIAGDSIDKALQEYEKLYQLFPQDLENLYAAATLMMNHEQYQDAQVWLQRIVKVDPKYKTAFLQLSQIKLQLKQYDSARHYSVIALEQDSAFNDARLLIARSYEQQYRYSQALEVYRDIVMRDSTFDIAIAEMEVLQKKIAYLRRMRQQRDSIQNVEPAPLENITNTDNQDD